MGREPCRAVCKPVLDAAAAEGRTSNFGCVAPPTPLNQDIPWRPEPGTKRLAVVGECTCDNWLVNELADTILAAMPVIAQVFL